MYRIVCKEIDSYPQSKKAGWEAKKTLPDISTKTERGEVNIKGREAEIKGTGDRILHRPYAPSQTVRDSPAPF